MGWGVFPLPLCSILYLDRARSMAPLPSLHVDRLKVGLSTSPMPSPTIPCETAPSSNHFVPTTKQSLVFTKKPIVDAQASHLQRL